MSNPKLDSIRVEVVYDECPDTSWIGEFSDTAEEGAINHRERCGGDRHQYRYFNPANPEYAEQDYAHILRLMDGDAWFVGVRAKAIIRLECGKYAHLIDIHSGGIWGIEVDHTDRSGINDCIKDEMAMLREIVTALGVKWNKKMAAEALENPVDA